MPDVETWQQLRMWLGQMFGKFAGNQPGRQEGIHTGFAGLNVEATGTIKDALCENVLDKHLHLNKYMEKCIAILLLALFISREASPLLPRPRHAVWQPK